MKKAFVILGMHRSGTSSVAGALARLGPKPPMTLLAPSEDNPRGFWESQLVVEQNDAILAAAGSYWRDWQAFAAARIDPERQLEFARTIGLVLKNEFAGAPQIILKDPRLCRLYALWDRPLNEAGYNPVFILPIRAPLDVAASLSRRNGVSMSDGLLLWLRHVLDAERVTRGRPRKMLLWSDFMADWREAVRGMAQPLGWAPDLEGRGAQDVDAFLSDDLPGGRAVEDRQSDPQAHVWVEEAWKALRALAREGDRPAELTTLDHLWEVMNASTALYGPAFGSVLWDEENARRQRDAAFAVREQLHVVTDRLEQNLMKAAEEILTQKAFLEESQIGLAELSALHQGEIRRADLAEDEINAVAARLTAQVDATQRLQDQVDRLDESYRALEVQRLALEECLGAAEEKTSRLEALLSSESDALSALREALRHRPVATWWRHRKAA